MAFDKTEKKEIAEIVGAVIDKKILPRFEKVEGSLVSIDRKLDATMEMTAKNSEDITLIKEDVGILKEDVTELKDTSGRMELKLNAVVAQQDDQGEDITKMKKVLKMAK